MATETAFEFDYPGLHGVMTVQVIDFADPDTPQVIIETADPWRITVKWNVDGQSASTLGGSWFVTPYLDDLDGVGPSVGAVAPTQQKLVSSAPANAHPRSYEATFEIAAGHVKPGLYRLTTALHHENSNGTDPNAGVRTSIAAFVDGPSMEFYEISPGV
jgi:hypothetical protein